MDYLCFMLLVVELSSLPMMMLYLISPYQTFNCIGGLVLGLICLMVLYRRVIKLRRIWIWFITFNLTLLFIMVIKALCA
jgi:multisubunit Na+/H+ antiporter MnhE subunit